MAFRKGYRAELELVEMLRKEGFYAVRIPVSGSKDIPCDVLAAKGNDRRAYQVKETRRDSVYIDKRHILRLLRFSKAFGFKAYIAVRWRGIRGIKWSILEIQEPEPVRIKRPKLL